MEWAQAHRRQNTRVRLRAGECAWQVCAVTCDVRIQVQCSWHQAQRSGQGWGDPQGAAWRAEDSAASMLQEFVQLHRCACCALWWLYILKAQLGGRKIRQLRRRDCIAEVTLCSTQSVTVGGERESVCVSV